MNFIQFRNSLEFNYNLTVTNKVCYILLLQRFAFIRNTEFNFTFIGNTRCLKFKFKCLLINFFKKPAPQFKSNSIQTTTNGIRFILIQVFHHNNQITQIIQLF